MAIAILLPPLPQVLTFFNPLLSGGRGGIYAPPATYRKFSLDVLIRGGSKYTQNLSFVITEHIELVEPLDFEVV